MVVEKAGYFTAMRMNYKSSEIPNSAIFLAKKPKLAENHAIGFNINVSVGWYPW